VIDSLFGGTADLPATAHVNEVVACPALVNKPISSSRQRRGAAYRWHHTDAALREQLDLEDEGYAATTEPGHAAVRYTNPTTGGDVMPTIRAEFHRLRAGAHTRPRRDVGSTVYQVFEGSGRFQLGDKITEVQRGDMIVVPSWTEWTINADTQFDLFAFSNAPIVERLHFNRTYITEGP
jgi:gentisate 1,2-dioxygenase